MHVDSIMTGHMNVHALEPDPTRRATSPTFLTDLLRNQLGYQGLSLPMRWDMGGITCVTRRERSSGARGRGGADAC